MPRYVILRHDTPPASDRPRHWDLMLEADVALRTWALECEPHYNIPLAAEQLPDHRREYLDYEGPVSGNRGSVTRWTSGEFTVVAESVGELQVALTSGRLLGTLVLTRSSESDQRWTARFDEP